MKFRIGPHIYIVRISEGQLRDSDRIPVDGLCCWSDRTIWINGLLPLAQRLDVLAHELAHAFEEHYGIATDSEGAANQKASFFVDLWKQLDGHGGLDALLRLKADGMVDDSQSDDTPNQSYAVQCPECKSMIGIGLVKTSRPHFNATAQRPVVERVATCPDCATSFAWVEGVTAGGLPNGRVLVGPSVHSLAS